MMKPRSMVRPINYEVVYLPASVFNFLLFGALRLRIASAVVALRVQLEKSRGIFCRDR
jgi:hypothetical protein